MSNQKVIKLDHYGYEEEEGNVEMQPIEDKVKGDYTIDVPLRIVSAKMVGNVVNCLVEWKERNDGIKPENSYLPNSFFRKRYSNLLLDYYESILKTKKKSK